MKSSKANIQVVTPQGDSRGTRRKKTIKNIVITAICVAMCTLLPQLFHAIPGGGKIFSPMHIPILICGLTLPWQYGLLCGVLGVVISSLVTSMPALVQVPAMAVECAVYGVACALLLKLLPIKRGYLKLYLALIGSMLTGRLCGGLIHALCFMGSYSFSAWASAYFAVSLPGIVLQLLLVPPIVRALEHAGLCDRPEWTTAERKEKKDG